jgi:hypothetical protein
MKLSSSSKAQSSAMMPDWKPEIRRRLANLQLPPTREAAIVEELAQRLDESYAELLASGVSEADAYCQAHAERVASAESDAQSSPPPMIVEDRPNTQRQVTLDDQQRQKNQKSKRRSSPATSAEQMTLW